MSNYTREQQIEDLAVIDNTTHMLSARLCGERQDECEAMVADYARISRYFCGYDEAAKCHLNTSTSKQMARMFQTIAYKPKITGFEVQQFEPLLKQCKVQIKSMLKRFNKKKKPCAYPELHQQPCFCSNLAAAVGREDYGYLNGADRQLRRELLKI